MADSELARAGALLTIDLGALCDNWRQLQRSVGRARCAAVLKADAYGLGAARVAPALAAAGCRRFFVAHLDEAIALKPLLPADASVTVLHGAMPGAEREFVAHRVRPVVNSRAQLDAWRRLAHQLDRELEMLLQVDTGMSRMGLPADELQAVASDPGALAGLRLAAVMSHLACADEPGHALNEAQRRLFLDWAAAFPGVPRSLAASAGMFLGADWCLELARPGYALYGGNPTAGPNPMRPVVSLRARILQVRRVDSPTTVGYGASHRVRGPTRLATLGLGYADGFQRALSNRGRLHYRGQPLPIVGRVSMDLTVVDVSALPEAEAQAGTLLDVLGPDQDLDALARDCGTIGYELLTQLGRRYQRAYAGA